MNVLITDPRIGDSLKDWEQNYRIPDTPAADRSYPAGNVEEMVDLIPWPSDEPSGRTLTFQEIPWFHDGHSVELAAEQFGKVAAVER
jgi:hypothetical protein